MRLLVLLICVLGVCSYSSVVRASSVSLRIDTDKPLHRVDPFIYGHFLEHIYQSVHGGLWGELVLDRSFEDTVGGGIWSVERGVLRQTDIATNIRYVFGDPSWRDYELTLDVRRTGGMEGALILFRCAGPEDFYWLNLGAMGNQHHWIERGNAGQGRWRPVSHGGDGTLETNRWYRVRIRCEGARFRVWLDDALLMDFTDTESPHLSGAVGVGSWMTANEYRNIQVRSLSGQALYKGVTRPVFAGALQRWNAYGDGQMRVTDRNPLNSRLCVELEGTSGETGVQQSNLAVRNGEPLEGSVWLRGEAPDGVVVRLRDGARVMAETRIRPKGGRWAEYSIHMTPTADSTHAVLQIGLIGKGRVAVDQVRLAPTAWQHAGGFRPDLLKAVTDLKPTVIRWPGGCFAEYYRWKDGVGPQHTRKRYPARMWDDIDPNAFGTDEFLALCRKLNTEPVIVVNSGRHDPLRSRQEYIQEACDWLEYCNGPVTSKWGKVRARNGHPQPYNVKYWEIDNEAWPIGADAYVSIFNEFAAAMRKVDPSIKLIACGSAGYDDNDTSRGWNARIIDGCAPGFDYLSIHHYENPDLFADGPRNYERFFGELRTLIRNSANPHAKVFVSEWNAQSTDWRTGLYAAGLLNAFERCADIIGMASPALWMRHTSATDWDNAFINFDQTGWYPAPNYVVMRLWRNSLLPNALGCSGDPGALNVSALMGPRRVVVRVVNPADHPVDLSIQLDGRFKPIRCNARLLAPGDLTARNTLQNPNQIRPVSRPTSLEDRVAHVRLPAHSAGIITFHSTPARVSGAQGNQRRESASN